MKLLIISHNPDRASFRQRIEVYLDILRENNISCEIAVLPSGVLAHRNLFKSARLFDAVFLHKKKLSLVDSFWLRRYSKKLIYNFDDAVMFDEDNPERNNWSRLMPFRRTVRLADLVIVGSSYLAQQARQFSDRVEILPLGLKVNDYNSKPSAKTDAKIRLVWIGSGSTIRYLEDIKPAIEAVGSRFSNVVLRIIGEKFFDMVNMPVEKRPWSAQTRGVELASSDIGLAPLPNNRFTQGKCSFKVLEYSASGLPVIASPVGTNRDNIREGITGFLADNYDQWVEKLSLLIKDSRLRQTMGTQGREYSEQFDIAVMGKRLCGIIRKYVGD